MSYLLSLDQGTSSSRSIVFNHSGQIVAMAQQELTQIFPQPGWVEHDPLEIWRTQLDTAREAIAKAGIQASDIHAVGITNQRETTVVWNRATGQPLHHAIVWQDRRTEPTCLALREAGLEPVVRESTGLVVDAYFSGTKLAWILDHVDGARAAADRGELAFGTVDSWLLWQLTGGTSTRGAVHATDVSNASRTMLFNIHEQRWDETLLGALRVPDSVLPQVQPSSHVYGHTYLEWFGARIPIAGIAGDQQSALFGQACFRPGLAKNTYGTGCFMLMHTGSEVRTSRNGLISTIAAHAGTERAYALEGSVFVGGAVVQWLRDGLRAIQASSAVEQLALSVPDSGGVIFVPAFTGLGAPYWAPQARGAILGLTRGTTLGHITRAALESIAYQSTALLEAMNADARACGGTDVSELRVDGGACVNDLLMQFQADLLGIPVVRPEVVETTALGAAYLAGLATGLYQGLDELASLWRVDKRFEPSLSRAQAQALMQAWQHAVTQVTT
ncbi:MAG TPA: glycerol kinase GlpK [Aquabacterium sp.]|uniref:glycerol kinase GlpK n=1 Tax=Aquabacterium sp. TaxID=1872578 RepID=UPI002E333AFF|nr:glycerol kinase GlpK [Aquabacterium sp.]HEX5372865.1 glycerol kinase GlpK [Aquabacterium sp.]